MRGETVIHGQRMMLEECYTCKTTFAMDWHTYKAADFGKESFTFCCPYGHKQHYCTGEREIGKMRRDRDRLAQRVAEKDDEIKRQKDLREHAERSASAYKGKVTRLKNRAAAGLCPCCNRTFQNLHKHMTTKHPGFKQEDEAA